MNRILVQTTNTGGLAPATYHVAVCQHQHHATASRATVTRPSALTTNTSVLLSCALLLLTSLLPIHAATETFDLFPLMVTTNGNIRVPNSTNFWAAQLTNVPFANAVNAVATNSGGGSGVSESYVTARTNETLLTATNRAVALDTALSNALSGIFIPLIATSSNTAAGATIPLIATSSNTAVIVAITASTNAANTMTQALSGVLVPFIATSSNAAVAAAITASTNAAGLMTNALYASLMANLSSTSNALQRLTYTNYVVHRPTDSMATISNKVYINTTNCVHIFEGGDYYGWTTTPSVGGNELAGTIVARQVRGVQYVGMGRVRFIITNSLSATGAVTAAGWPEPLMVGNFFAIEDFDGLQFRDLEFYYQRTNYHGPCGGRGGNCIFLNGPTNANNVMFNHVSIDGAPDQGICVVGSVYGVVKSFTNQYFLNCIFKNIGSTNYNGGTNNVLNPPGTIVDGAGVYPGRWTFVTGSTFDNNTKDIEWEGVANTTASVAASTMEYQAFVIGNVFRNFHYQSCTMLTTNYIVNNIMMCNLWVHSNKLADYLWEHAVWVNGGHNVRVENNTFAGGMTCMGVYGGSSPLATDWFFRNNVCESNIQVYVHAMLSGTPGGRTWFENNTIKRPQSRVMYDDASESLICRFNYIDSEAWASSTESFWIGAPSGASGISNFVFRFNDFYRTNTGSGKPLILKASTVNMDCQVDGNTWRGRGYATNIYDEVAPNSTLTNRPTAASQMYTNNVHSATLTASIYMGPTSSVSIVVWDKIPFQNAYTSTKYGPEVNGSSSDMWRTLTVPLNGRSVFTVSNEQATTGFGGIIHPTNWVINRR